MQQSVKNVCSISTAMTSGRCVCHCRAADGAAYAAAKQAVEVEPLNPNLFWSAAEDGTVRQFDKRLRYASLGLY